MLETSRRRVLSTLNSRYIYGRVVGTFLSIRPIAGASGNTSFVGCMETLTVRIHHHLATPTCCHIPHRDGYHHKVDRQIQFLLCRKTG